MSDTINYEIDYSGWFEEGGYCQVYPIKDHKRLVFKEFRNKKKASEALFYQTKLAKFDLAPKIYSSICKLKFAQEKDILFDEQSDWGYITEYAKACRPNKDATMPEIQSLVDDILIKTGLKFWDCHWYNIGFIKRNKKKKIVCIDTGKESFNGISNAWGMSTPGPKCCFCKKYQCDC